MTVRKPSQMSELGERIASLAASFEAEQNYSHDRWHRLNNDMTPLVQLPERLTRDMAKLQGTFEGRMAAMSKDMERSIQLAVERAVDPVREEVRDHDKRIVALEAANIKDDSVKGFLQRVIHSPVIGGFIGAVAAAIAILWDRLTGVAP